MNSPPRKGGGAQRVVIIVIPACLGFYLPGPSPQDVTPFALVHHVPAVRADALVLRKEPGFPITCGQLYRVRASRRAARLHRVARPGEPHRRRPPVQAPEMVRAVPRIVIVAVLRRVRLPPVHGDLLAVVQVLREIFEVLVRYDDRPVLLPVARVRELPVAELAVEQAVHIVVATGTRR